MKISPSRGEVLCLFAGNSSLLDGVAYKIFVKESNSISTFYKHRRILRKMNM